MHGLPSRTGRELIDRLRNAAELSEIVLLTGSTADRLIAEADGLVRGVEIVRSGGARERIGCEALILACNGYGGSPELVRRFIPEMADALYFGHSGNRGDAVLWGEALGAELACLGAYQGHGSVATPHNTLITWAVIMEGGIQINAQGQRFCDETRGYSGRPRKSSTSRVKSLGMCLMHALPRSRGNSRTFKTQSAPVR